MEGFLGQVVLFAGEFAPLNWEYCQGKELLIDKNSNLFTILGIRHGGDGRTTFHLPTMPSPDGASYIICVDGLYPSRHR